MIEELKLILPPLRPPEDPPGISLALRLTVWAMATTVAVVLVVAGVV